MTFKKEFDALDAEDLPLVLEMAAQQPYGVEYHMADGVSIKQMHIPLAGTYVPQHAHSYGHTSMLASGSIRVWQDGELRGDYTAPTGLFIEAGTKHRFLSLVPDTIVYCVHNTSRAPGIIQVSEEHHIKGI